MNRTRNLAAIGILGAALLAACGNSNDNGAGDGSPSAANLDGGIPCGNGVACTASETCCRSGSNPPTCTPRGACTGSAISCSSSAQCSGAEVCCFAYAQPEGGGGGGLGVFGANPFGGAGGTPSFTADCAADCATGDNVHFRLCASATDCPSGQMCVTTGAPYAPYCNAGFGGAGGLFGGLPGDGGFTFPEGGFPGGFMLPEGGFPFLMFDGGFPFSMQPGAGSPPPDDGGGSSDATSE